MAARFGRFGCGVIDLAFEWNQLQLYLDLLWATVDNQKGMDVLVLILVCCSLNLAGLPPPDVQDLGS